MDIDIETASKALIDTKLIGKDSYHGSESSITVPGGSFLHFWQPALSHWAHTQTPSCFGSPATGFAFFFPTPFFPVFFFGAIFGLQTIWKLSDQFCIKRLANTVNFELSMSRIQCKRTFKTIRALANLRKRWKGSLTEFLHCESLLVEFNFIHWPTFCSIGSLYWAHRTWWHLHPPMLAAAWSLSSSAGSTARQTLLYPDMKY